jgi:hypothetical protein
VTGLEFLNQLFRVGPTKRSHPDRKPSKYRWRYGNLKVQANTKSEARSLLKGILGQPLPVGAGYMIRKVGT